MIFNFTREKGLFSLKDRQSFFNATVMLIFVILLSNTTSVYSQNLPETKYFYIQSKNEHQKSNRGYWDVPGAPKGIETGRVQDINIWEVDNGPDRLFRFEKQSDGTYKILPKHGKDKFAVRYDVKHPQNNSNVEIADKNSRGTNWKVEVTSSGYVKFFADNGRVMCLQNRNSGNGSNLLLYDNEIGSWTEWALISENGKKWLKPMGLPLSKGLAAKKTKESKTVKNAKADDRSKQAMAALSKVTGVVPQVEGVSFAEGSSKNILADFDNTCNLLSSAKSKVASFKNDFSKANNVFNKVKDLNNDIEGIDRDCNNTNKVVDNFIYVPFVRKVANGAKATVNSTKNLVGKVGSSLKPLQSAGSTMSTISGAVNKIDGKLNSCSSKLEALKKNYERKANCAYASGDKNAIKELEKNNGAIKAELSRINSNTNQLLKNLQVLSKANSSLAKLDRPINKVKNGLKKVKKVVHKVSNGAKKTDKALSKEYKKDIKVVFKKIKIRLSVKKILTGDGKFKKVAKYLKGVTKWAQNLVKGPMNKLKEKAVNKIPGAKELQREVAKVKGKLADMKRQALSLSDAEKKISNSESNIDNAVAKATRYIKCK